MNAESPMKAASLSLQDNFLSAVREERVSVAIYLTNGVRLIGQIEAFDAYVILLKAGGTRQLIYKHAVATMLPSTEVSVLDEDNYGNRIRDHQPAKSAPIVTKKRARVLV